MNFNTNGLTNVTHNAALHSMFGKYVKKSFHFRMEGKDLNKNG